MDDISSSHATVDNSLIAAQKLGNGSFHRIAYADWGRRGNPHAVVSSARHRLPRAVLLRGIDRWSVGSKLSCPMRVAEFEGVGHAPALMSREQIAAVKEFLLE
jgi:hypothetical protein